MAAKKDPREIAKQVRTLLLDVAMPVPQQNDRLRELELINENMRLEIQRMDRMSSMTALHGVPTTLCLMGRDNAIVEVEKPTIEVTYIPDEHTSKAIEYLRDVKNWQMLLGQ